MLRSILVQAIFGLTLLNIMPAHATDYYLSNSGDDSRAGTSIETAWKSLERANQQILKPGDRLLLKGSEVFLGGLKLDSKSGGDGKKPVVIGSFGEGKAVIEAGDGTAIDIHNAGGVAIENLVVRGSGYPKNRGDGVIFRNEGGATASTEAISLRNVEASGFAGRNENGNGIYISGVWHDVRIEDCETHDNRYNGIFVNGARGGQILRCRSWGNPGDPEFHENWSGCGIFVTVSDDVLIDHCEAWENGYLSKCDAGGPVGIWAALANKITIQYCHSHHNRTNGIHDGGGFDFDGGMTNSVMQYNYAHDNDGPGYLIYEWGAGGLKNITARYNVSINDGGKNGFAGFYIASDVPDQPIVGCRVEKNTVVAAPRGNDKPSALEIHGSLKNIELVDNLFIVQGVPVMNAKVQPETVRFESNQFSILDGADFRWNGTTYSTVEQWQQATGQNIAKDLLLPKP